MSMPIAYKIYAPCISMSAISERLKWAREQAGYGKPADAARAMGVSLPTYYGHENGTRGLTRGAAAKYALRFHVTIDWLLEGRGEPRSRHNETEAALLDAFRKLPANEANAYLQLILQRARSG